MKILFIEDTKTLQSIITDILEAHGHEVITAQDGIEGFEKLAQESFDLILLNLIMLRMNGYDFIGEFEASDKFSAIPVIIISSDVTWPDRESSLLKNAASIMKKPVAPNDLIETIDHLVN